jgi:hypothetical protein
LRFPDFHTLSFPPPLTFLALQQSFVIFALMPGTFWNSSTTFSLLTEQRAYSLQSQEAYNLRSHCPACLLLLLTCPCWKPRVSSAQPAPPVIKTTSRQ